MSQPLETVESAAAAELAVVTRSGFVESRHVGSAVVVEPDGAVSRRLGDPDALLFPRSTLKPFQAIAAMKAGAPLVGAQVAIAAGSHTGSLEHMRTAAGMLAAAGLSPEDLRCPPAWPKDEDARDRLRERGEGKQALAMNCSGKHAAFLWACAVQGWDTASYLDPDHPLQRLVLETVQEFTGDAPALVGVDGCGAPLPAITLTGLARGYARLGAAIRNIGEDARTATLATAMVDYPEMVQGHGEPNTVVIEGLDVIAKLGAEGVLCVATPQGAAAAVKVLDGSSRPATLTALTLLAGAGHLPGAAVEAVLGKILHPITGGGEPVGAIRLGAAFDDAEQGSGDADQGFADAGQAADDAGQEA